MIELVVLCALVTWRLTRLWMSDTILDTPRSKIMGFVIRKRRNGKVPDRAFKIHELLTCWWCFTVWVAAPVVAVADLSLSVPAPLLVWFASAGLATLIHINAE